MTFSDRLRDRIRKWLLPRTELGRFAIEIDVDNSDIIRKLAEVERAVDRIANKYAAIGNVPLPRPAVQTGSGATGGLGIGAVVAMAFCLGATFGVVVAALWPMVGG